MLVFNMAICVSAETHMASMTSYLTANATRSALETIHLLVEDCGGMRYSKQVKEALFLSIRFSQVVYIQGWNHSLLLGIIDITHKHITLNRTACGSYFILTYQSTHNYYRDRRQTVVNLKTPVLLKNVSFTRD